MAVIVATCPTCGKVHEFADTDLICTRLNLDDWLDAVAVHDPDMWENDAGPKGWWAVSNDEGIVAYFANEVDAYRFRLDYINRQLNP